MTKPIWLLDVDGVINAVPFGSDYFAMWDVWIDWENGTARAGGSDWPINWSPSVTRYIREMHESGLVEVRWLTTWEDQANEELRQLVGLPEFEVAGRYTGNEQALWWKVDYAKAVIDTGLPVIWTDDDLNLELAADPQLDNELFTVNNLLKIAPNTRTGLSKEDLAEITAFINEQNGVTQ